MAKHQGKQPRRSRSRTSWDPVAEWYNGWVGKRGSKHHRKLAIPTVLRLLDLKRGMTVLEFGAGQGVLAPAIAKAGATYTGIEISDKLLHYARKHHGHQGRFLLGDVRKLQTHPHLQSTHFDAGVFLLSLQNMSPLHLTLRAAAWSLKPGGKLVILLLHPCFHIPRQSGWGWDHDRKLQYRRIDQYMSSKAVSVQPPSAQRKAATLSFHRPLMDYINGLAEYGLWIDRVEEIPTYKVIRDHEENAKAKNRAYQEIPLFLGIRAQKVNRV